MKNKTISFGHLMGTLSSCSMELIASHLSYVGTKKTVLVDHHGMVFPDYRLKYGADIPKRIHFQKERVVNKYCWL